MSACRTSAGMLSGPAATLLINKFVLADLMSEGLGGVCSGVLQNVLPISSAFVIIRLLFSVPCLSLVVLAD